MIIDCNALGSITILFNQTIYQYHKKIERCQMNNKEHIYDYHYKKPLSLAAPNQRRLFKNAANIYSEAFIKKNAGPFRVFNSEAELSSV